MKNPMVYIRANAPRGTLYVGVTSKPAQRMEQHGTQAAASSCPAPLGEGLGPIGRGESKLRAPSRAPLSFVAKYGLLRLVYAEHFQFMEDAIAAEKRLKRMRRQQKIRLIESVNPQWNDLTSQVSD